MPCPTCNESDTEACRKCEFCQEEVYCSEKCEAIGWSAHHCNVLTVPDKSVTLFLPEADEGEYILRHIDPKGYIDQRFVNGKMETTWSEPSEEVPGSDFSYSMTIEKPNGETIELNNLESIIHANAHNTTAAKLAANREGHVLWATPQRLARESLEFPEDGLVKISVHNAQGKLISSIAGVYALGASPEENSRRVNPIQADYQNKFRRGDSAARAARLEVLRGKDVAGNMVQLTFDGNRLADVEYQYGPADPSDEYAYQTASFQCDPENIDHVTGLVMALEDKMADGSLSGPIIQQQFDIIDTHRKRMDLGTAKTSPKINAAIQYGTQALWALQPIDLKLKLEKRAEKFFQKIDSVNMSSPDGFAEIQRKIEAVIEKLQEARKSDSWMNKRRRGMYKRELDDWITALETALRKANYDEAAKKELWELKNRALAIKDMTTR